MAKLNTTQLHTLELNDQELDILGAAIDYIYYEIDHGEELANQYGLSAETTNQKLQHLHTILRGKKYEP